MNVTLRRRYALVLAPAILWACGGDDTGTASTACTAIAGEKHLAQNDTMPDGLPVMLHVAGKTCISAGKNVLRVHYIEDENNPEGMQMSPEGAPPHVMILAVEAKMPSMGHGTAEAPKINTASPSEFEVNFQMPGQWKIEAALSVAEVTATTQTVAFDVTVY